MKVISRAKGKKGKKRKETGDGRYLIPTAERVNEHKGSGEDTTTRGPGSRSVCCPWESHVVEGKKGGWWWRRVGKGPGILLNWGRRCYKAPRKSAPASTPDIPSVLFRPRGDAGYVGALKIIAGTWAGIPRGLCRSWNAAGPNFAPGGGNAKPEQRGDPVRHKRWQLQFATQFRPFICSQRANPGLATLCKLNLLREWKPSRFCAILKFRIFENNISEMEPGWKIVCFTWNWYPALNKLNLLENFVYFWTFLVQFQIFERKSTTRECWDDERVLHWVCRFARSIFK